jgi:hypothetical protein
MITSRRIALATAALVLGFTACGDPSTSSSPTSTVVTSNLPKIKLGGGGNGGGALSASAEAAPADRMMMWQPIEFVYNGTTTLPATGTAWVFQANPNVDPARIAAIAAALGVEGEVRPLSADMGGGWMVGAADYSTSSITVSTDGMVSWWYNPAPIDYTTTMVPCDGAKPEIIDPAVTDAATSGVAVTETIPGDSVIEPAPGDTVDPALIDPVEPPVCEMPLPPTGVPTGEEALAKAKELFTSLGYDMADFEFDVYADEWSANVTAYLMIGGQRTQVAMSAGYGGEGVLSWASGFLGEPQIAGDYPLVSPAECVERLNDQQGMWGWGGGFMETVGGVARSAEVAVEAPSVAPELPVETTPSESLPTGDGDVPTETIAEPAVDPALIDPAIIEPGVEAPVDMEPMIVTLTDVRLDLVMNWSEDGSVWMLPACTFSADDGGLYTVIAVDEAFVEVPEPVAVDEPGAIEPAPDTIAPVEPGTDPVIVEIDQAAASAALVGLTFADAEAAAAANGWTLRMTQIDGVDQAITMDLRFDRVNVAVTDGVVTAVTSIG